MSDFVRQSEVETDFSTSDSWVILSPIEQSIKRKIEAVGVPLKDWDIQINYGIKTGFNDAFIISTEKRNEILSNCTDEDERTRTADLIRPILRGRDIKRYGYDWADLWLINTHNGIKGKVDRIHIEDYPAVKTHLDQYWEKISKRADKGDTPYNLRNCAYLDDFSKPKIIYREISTDMEACIAPAGWFINNKLYMITGLSDHWLNFICAFLNTKLFTKIVLSSANFGGGKGVDFMNDIKLPRINDIVKFQKLLSSEHESYFAKLYGLSAEEAGFIEFQ